MGHIDSDGKYTGDKTLAGEGKAANKSALNDKSSQPLAYVGLVCGRQYLKVAGMVVAVEGDICRDPMILDEYRHPREEHHLKWMPDMLEYVAKTINEEVAGL